MAIARQAIQGAIMIALALSGLSACIQQPIQAEQWCLARDSAPPDKTIIGCTSLIDVGYQTSPWLPFANRGQAYMRQDDPDRAIADFDRAIQLHSNWATPYNDRGVARAMKGQFEPAIQDFDHAASLDPQFAIALKNLGTAYIANGDADHAIDALNRALKVAENDVTTPGTLWFQSDKGSAEPAPKTDAPSAKLIAEAYLELGRIDLGAGRYNFAIREANESIRHDPSAPGGYILLASVKTRRDDVAGALKEAERAVAAAPSSDTVWNERCWLRMIAGELEAAESDCNQALKLRPQVAKTLDSRGWVRFKAGRFDEALSDFNAALQIDPKMASSLYGRGFAELGKGDMATARRDIAAAKEIEPELPAIYARYHL